MSQEQSVGNRKRMCIKEIKDMDKEITRETVRLGILALSVGVGVIGIMYFGGELLNSLIIEDIFNMELDVQKIIVVLQLLVSVDVALVSYVLAREKLGVLQADIEYKKYYQKELDDLCKNVRKRVRKKVEVRDENKV